MRVLPNCVGLLLGVVCSFIPQAQGSIPVGDWHFLASHVLAFLPSFKFTDLPTLPHEPSSLTATSL